MPAHLKPFLFLGLILIDGFTFAVAAARPSPSGNNFFQNQKPQQFNTAGGDGDPYKILGVKRTASDDEIQKAYRKRAKETHPDKNASPTATDEFRRVTSAFEILGDPVNRKRYDRAMMDAEAKKKERRRGAHNQHTHRQQYQYQQREQSSSWQKQHNNKNNNMDRNERQKRHAEMITKSRSTQSRITKFTTKSEFEKTMLDSSTKQRYKTNCLIMLVANKHAEKWAESKLYFPYPFVGEDGSYERVLQVAKVRFNSQTELTRLFRAESNSNTPHIIFAKKGDAIRNFQVFNTKRLNTNNENEMNSHREFRTWVESQLLIEVTVANRHALPVDVRIVRSGQAIGSESSLQPNYQRTFSLHVGDRIFAFDERLDTFPGAIRNGDKIGGTKGVLLLDVIVTAAHDSYTIPPSRCYDLSTQCHMWIAPLRRGKQTIGEQCQTNPEFMHHVCPFTCGVCSEHIISDIAYLAFHRPIHSFPVFLQGIVRFGRDLLVDVADMAMQHMTAAVALFAVGLLITLNISSSSKKSKTHPPNQHLDGVSEVNLTAGTVLDVSLLLCAGALAAWLSWITSITATGVPPYLRGIHSDLIGVSNFPVVFILLLCVGALTGVHFRSIISYCIRGDANADSFVIFIATPLTFALFTGLSLTFLSPNEVFDDTPWYYAWNYHKGAASIIVFIGAFVGVGLVSFERVIIWPIRKNLPLLAFLCNWIVLVVVGFLSLESPFTDDLMNVIQLRKNAAVAFVLIGMAIGHIFGNNLDILDSDAYNL